MQHLEALRIQLRGQDNNSGDVSARTRERHGQSLRDSVLPSVEDNGDGVGGLAGGTGGGWSNRQDGIWGLVDHFAGQARQPFDLTSAKIDDEVRPLDEAGPGEFGKDDRASGLPGTADLRKNAEAIDLSRS